MIITMKSKGFFNTGLEIATNMVTIVTKPSTFMTKSSPLVSAIQLTPCTGGSVGISCHVGSREFDSGWTYTQGLKITEEKVLPL